MEDYFCRMEIELTGAWKNALNGELSSPYFIELVENIQNKYKEEKDTIFPPEKDVFNAFKHCDLEHVKVVIVGQDPYPTKGHANGLCFSLNPDVRPFAKSLTNIFKEIEADLGKPFPPNGDLSRWAKQGVFLLNSILTVKEGTPLSHQQLGWEKFTDAVIRMLVQQEKGIVFMLWGSKAISKLEGLDTSNHLVLTSVHPSPLSAYRGFFGCKHFSKANEYLAKAGKEVIDW